MCTGQLQTFPITIPTMTSPAGSTLACCASEVNVVTVQALLGFLAGFSQRDSLCISLLWTGNTSNVTQ